MKVNLPVIWFLLSLLLQLEAGRNFETFIVEYFRHRVLFKHQLYIICLCSLFWHLWPSSIRNVSVLQIVLDLYLSWCFSLRFWKPVLGVVDKKHCNKSDTDLGNIRSKTPEQLLGPCLTLPGLSLTLTYQIVRYFSQKMREKHFVNLISPSLRKSWKTRTRGSKDTSSSLRNPVRCFTCLSYGNWTHLKGRSRK